MPEESLKEQSLRYQVEPALGKLEIKATKPMATQHDSRREFLKATTARALLLSSDLALATTAG